MHGMINRHQCFLPVLAFRIVKNYFYLMEFLLPALHLSHFQTEDDYRQQDLLARRCKACQHYKNFLLEQPYDSKNKLEPIPFISRLFCANKQLLVIIVKKTTINHFVIIKNLQVLKNIFTVDN